MRKCMLILCFVILLCTPSSALFADGIECGLCGDVTGDGIIDISDVAAMISWYHQWPIVPPNCPLAADMDCDGYVNVKSVEKLINFLFLGGPAPCDPEAYPLCAE